jgi:hypothetical protein
VLAQSLRREALLGCGLEHPSKPGKRHLLFFAAHRRQVLIPFGDRIVVCIVRTRLGAMFSHVSSKISGFAAAKSRIYLQEDAAQRPYVNCQVSGLVGRHLWRAIANSLGRRPLSCTSTELRPIETDPKVGKVNTMSFHENVLSSSAFWKGYSRINTCLRLDVFVSDTVSVEIPQSNCKTSIKGAEE